MGIDKTVVIEPDEDPPQNRATENEFDPLQTASAPTARFNTIITDTAYVTEDKISFSKEEIKKLVALETNYELQEKFAEGGQGIISTGRDKILNRYVAIKTLKSDYLDNAQVIDSFITEAKITAQLDHPSIIPLYTINSDNIDDGLHISMKLIHGSTLKELADHNALLLAQYRRGKIRELEKSILNERLEDFIKVCDAISFAHNKKVLHKDLKPDNIMIGKFHEVYVMDWGIAALYEEDDNPDSDKKEQISGTPGFIAPEVVTGGKSTPASDQYALGMILFELITMKPGITGESIKEVFEKTRDGRLEPITHRFHECKIAKDLIAVVKKATSINPADRYASVSKMADDIRCFLKNEELVARPDNIPRTIFRIILKHKNLAATIMLLLLLSFAGVAILGLIKQNIAERKVNQSLIQRNQAERKSKKRAVKMVKLHSAIKDNAHFIDRHLFHIVHVLNRFADKTQETLESDKFSKNKIFYPTSQFEDKDNLPPGTVFSPAYKRDISLDVFNYSLAPGLKYDQAEKQLMKICSLRRYLVKYLVNSDSNQLVFENIEKGRERAIKEGFPIKWIYIALDNGLMVNYPGSKGLPEDYDPRIRPWYKDAKKTRRPKWSTPYVDISGLGVIISVSNAMYDRKGEFYGVASFDMTFDYITEKLMCRDCSNPAVLARYLIDSKGNVILSSRLSDEQIYQAEKNASKVTFKPFPYTDIQQHIIDNPSGQFEVESNGKPLLIGYAYVQTLNWYYVEEIDLEQYLNE